MIRGLLKMLKDGLFRRSFPTPPEGAPAPPFTAPDQNGTPRSLAEWRGWWVVLWFFPKADTPG